jgi:hypothetical protein
MKNKLLLLLLFATASMNAQYINPTGVYIPDATAASPSPGIVSAYTDADTFTYDGKAFNHYGFGFYNKTTATGNASNAGKNIYLSAFFGIDFFTSGAAVMRISKEGFVGIGTVSPTARLEVNSGTAGISGLKITQLTTTAGTVSVIGIDSGGNVVKVPSAQGVIYLSAYTSLSSAFTALNGTSTIGTLVIDKNLSMSGSLTVQSGKTIKFLNGNKITLMGYTLSINGGLEAGISQIFDMTSGGTVSGTPKIAYAVPQWWQPASASNWDASIKAAVDFYQRVYFPPGEYITTQTIELKKETTHYLFGESEASTLVNTGSNFIFKMTGAHEKGLIIETLRFFCVNGIRLNEENITFVDGPTAPYINRIRISDCFFKSAEAANPTGTAIQCNMVFDSEINNNQIYDFNIGIHLRGSDINAIGNNRIANFGKYGILDESFNTFGSQNQITHNDILNYKGASGGGAMIKTTSRHVQIKDNYLENGPTLVKAYFDCSNIGLQDATSFPYSIDIRGNRCDIGVSATYCYIIQDTFSNLFIDNNKNTGPYTPPSTFVTNTGGSPAYFTDFLKSRHNGQIEKEIHIASCTSFGAWNNFNSAIAFTNSSNGGVIIDAKNVSTAFTIEGNGNPDPSTYFNPLKISIKTGVDNVLSLKEGLQNGEKEMFKRVMFRVTLRGGQTAINNGSQNAQVFMKAMDASGNFNNTVYNQSPVLTRDWTIVEYASGVDYPNRLYINVADNIEIKAIELVPILAPSGNKSSAAQDPKSEEIIDRLNKLEEKVTLMDTELGILKEVKPGTVNAEKTIRVYPNPVSDIMNIDFGAANNEAFELDLYDASGKSVLEQKFSNKAAAYNVSLTDLAQGSYVYKITGKGFIKTGIILKN